MWRRLCSVWHRWPWGALLGRRGRGSPNLWQNAGGDPRGSPVTGGRRDKPTRQKKRPFLKVRWAGWEASPAGSRLAQPPRAPQAPWGSSGWGWGGWGGLLSPRDNIMCHIHSGGCAKHMAVRPQERGDMWHHPTVFLVPDCSSGFRACGGGRSHGGPQPRPERSVPINALHPAVSPQRMSPKGTVLPGSSGHQVLQLPRSRGFGGHRDCWKSPSAGRAPLEPCSCCS